MYKSRLLSFDLKYKNGLNKSHSIKSVWQTKEHYYIIKACCGFNKPQKGFRIFYGSPQIYDSYIEKSVQKQRYIKLPLGVSKL